MNEAEMKAELEHLRAENAKAQKPKTKGRHQPQGSVRRELLSLYGMGRFPVTLYMGEYRLRVLEHADEIKSFIVENDSRLKAKE